MQAVIVNNLCTVNPHLAAIVGVCVEQVAPASVDPQVAGPTHSKIVPFLEVGPSLPCILVVGFRNLTLQVGFLSVQLRQPMQSVHLVESLFFNTVKKARGRGCWRRCGGRGNLAIEIERMCWDSLCSPMSIRTIIPHLYAMPASSLKELRLEGMPASSHRSRSTLVTPAMKPIIVHHK